MAFAGLDIGTLTIKAVVIEDGQILGRYLLVISEEAEVGARKAIEEALRQAGLPWESLKGIVATGAGRKFITFTQKQKTSLSCLAKGVSFLYPEVRTIFDVGAESSTVIRVNPRGLVEDSVGHDRCASGTGVFLEAMAKLMMMPIEEMARASLLGEKRAEISNMCAIFAEQEVISHVHRKPPTPKNDIIKGIHGSMAVRIAGLAKRIGIKPQVLICGGVARNVGFVRELEAEVKQPILVPEEPQFVAALGAARLAVEEK